MQHSSKFSHKRRKERERETKQVKEGSVRAQLHVNYNRYVALNREQRHSKKQEREKNKKLK